MSLTPKEDLERYCGSVNEAESDLIDYHVSTQLSEGQLREKTDHFFLVRKSAGGVDPENVFGVEYIEI